MTAAQFEKVDANEAKAVLSWRFEELVRAGYDAEAALTIATHVEVDLHEAVDLVRKGCPSDIAMQIVL